VTPLERRCRLLLRAYPAWYRRERAGEMLDTLLEASPPGRNWPSPRDAMSLIRGGLRVRGMAVRCLAILWAGLGAAGAGYILTVSVQVPAIPTYSRIPCWAGEPGLIIATAELGGAVWLALTIPVLTAGLIRLRGRGLRAGAWAGAWVAGLALMIPVADWQTSAPAVNACNNQGCVLAGYTHAVVSWAQLPVLAGWLALATAMTLILARPTRSRGLPALG
jgi:hypothetical protein